MTSTISSENKKSQTKQGVAMYLWSLRKNSGLAIVFTVLAFMSLPMIQIAALAANRGNYYSEGNYESFMKVLYPSVFSFITVVFSLIFAAVNFSYLHNKRSVDLFGSLPVSRRVQMTARIFSTFTLTAVPMTVITLISLLICSVSMPGGAWVVCKGFLWLLLSIVANISFVALLSVCAGSVVDVIVSYCAISAAWPLIVFVMHSMPSWFIPGYVSSSPLNLTLLTAVSPISISFIGCYYPDAGKLTAFTVWWIIFTLLCLAAVFVLIKKRRFECAQTAFAFSLPKIIIRLLTNAISAVLIGLLFMSIISSSEASGGWGGLLWFAIGAFFGAMASHLILQFIYNRTMKGFARTLYVYFISVAAVLALTFTVSFGLFGSDVYVPQAGEVKNAEISVDIMNNQYDNVINETVTLSAPEEIESVISAHRSITDNLGQFYQKPYSSVRVQYYIADDITDEKNLYYSNFNVSYKLKNGKTVTRSYNIDFNANGEIYGAMSKMIEDTDYIRKALTFLRAENDPTAEITYVALSPNWEKYEQSEDMELLMQSFSEKISDSASATKELAQALRDDIKNMSDEEICAALSFNEGLCGISFDIDINDNSKIPHVYETIYIDSSFKNTVKVLEKHGIDTKALFDVFAYIEG